MASPGRARGLRCWGYGLATMARPRKHYVAILAKLRTWRSRPLSELGKVKVANMFLYSRLWYRTAVIPPVSDRVGVGGYQEVERQVAAWVFRGRQEVSAARLRDSYDQGGAQLADIGDRVRAQRVGWLIRLLAMPEDSFPRVLAGALIGDQGAGFVGLGVLAADLGRLSLVSRGRGRSMAPGGFYWSAIKAWSMLTIRITGGLGRLGDDHVFCNPEITGEAGTPITPIPWMVRRGLVRVGQVRGHSGIGLHRDRWFELVELRRWMPNLPTSDEPRYILSGPAGDKDVRCVSSKELYLTFRSMVDNERHFEAKWDEALGAGVVGEWKEVWERLHKSNCSLRVRSHVWRQLNLNFWTPYMDYAYIARGDGCCCFCGEWARRRWHVVVECEVVVRLWSRLGEMVEVLGGGAVVEVAEMALGMGGREPGTVLRNRLGYTLRSAVMSARCGVRRGGVGENVDRLWSQFLRRLRKELVEEWYVARLEGSVVSFAARTLVAGLLGRMEEGEVVWSAVFDGIGYQYWDLFQ